MFERIRARIRKPMSAEQEARFRWWFFHPFAVRDGEIRIIDITGDAGKITVGKIDASAIYRVDCEEDS